MPNIAETVVIAALRLATGNSVAALTPV